MASLKIALLLFSTLLPICRAAITPVCDPQRMADLGLNVENLKFCDKSLPFDVRAKDLVDRMIAEEKVKQLGSTSEGVERLGLPPYEWWSEALHGVSDVGHGTKFNKDVPSATSFPTPITLAACFNRKLWKNMGEVVSTEARSMHNVGISGLTFWSPTMNVVRDPRWGRIMETPGEDPYLVGEYVVSYVRGLQDVLYEDLSRSAFRPLKVAACCKHYTAYDLDSWLGIDRTHFDAKVAERDLIETFNRPFEKCVKDGDVSSVMCSFNNMNGLPTCADTKLLSDTIRGEWNLNGYIVSDCDSIEVIVDSQRFLDDTPEDAVRQVLRAGLDLDCGVYYTNYTLNAIKQGKVRESDVDKALKNLYVVLMRLGFFDGSPEFDALGKEDICNEEHIELAREAARQGIVLLKNDRNTLPLDASKLKSVAAVGPHAEATAAMIGNYAGVPCRYMQPKDGYANYTKVNFMRGCNGVQCPNTDWIANAVMTSQNSDATIIHVGLDISIEAEWRDRTSLFLPGNQTQLVNQIVDAAASEHPVILVIFSGGPVDVSFAQNNSKIGAIIWAGYPGEEGGNALADIIFGKYSPGGRLPLTWYYNDYVNQIPMTSMMLRPDNVMVYPGRTYKFYDGPLLYPFGYGLSYTEFEYTLLSSANALDVRLSPLQHCYPLRYSAGVAPPCPSVLVKDTACTETIDFEVEVKNVGKMDGSNIITAYSIPPGGIDIGGTPLKQLVGFERVFVKAGSSEIVQFSIDACMALSLVTDTAYTILPFGESTIVIDSGNGEKLSFPLQVQFSYL
ncbi:hypothetical protein ACLOJK_022003 [Asimina triloba]